MTTGCSSQQLFQLIIQVAIFKHENAFSGKFESDLVEQIKQLLVFVGYERFPQNTLEGILGALRNQS